MEVCYIRTRYDEKRGWRQVMAPAGRDDGTLAPRASNESLGPIFADWPVNSEKDRRQPAIVTRLLNPSLGGISSSTTFIKIISDRSSYSGPDLLNYRPDRMYVQSWLFRDWPNPPT